MRVLSQPEQPVHRESHYRLAKIRELMEQVVCTSGCDEGVVLLDVEGKTYYDSTLNARVYQHPYFSPLGDALIEIYKLTDTETVKVVRLTPVSNAMRYVCMMAILFVIFFCSVGITAFIGWPSWVDSVIMLIVVFIPQRYSPFNI